MVKLLDSDLILRVDGHPILYDCGSTLIWRGIPANNHVDIVVDSPRRRWKDLVWLGGHQAVEYVRVVSLAVGVPGGVPQEIRFTNDKILDDSLQLE